MHKNKITLLFLILSILWMNPMILAVENSSAALVSTEKQKESQAITSSASVKKIKTSWEDKLPEADLAVQEMEGTKKSLEGMVSGAGYNGLAVELPKPGKNDPSEIWLDYVKGLKLSGVQKLAELQTGDTVRVQYKEVADGRRLLEEVELVKKAPAEPVEAVEEEEEGENE